MCPLAALLLLGESAARSGPVEARQRAALNAQRGAVRRARLRQNASRERPADLRHDARAPSGRSDRRTDRRALVALVEDHDRPRGAPRRRRRRRRAVRGGRASGTLVARRARLRRADEPELRAPERERCLVGALTGRPDRLLAMLSVRPHLPLPLFGIEHFNLRNRRHSRYLSCP